MNFSSSLSFHLALWPVWGSLRVVVGSLSSSLHLKHGESAVGILVLEIILHRVEGRISGFP